MLLIHFIDDADGQPLCSTPESDRWLWTINPRAVTCPDCASHLSSSAHHDRAEAKPPDATATSADESAAQSA